MRHGHLSAIWRRPFARVAQAGALGLVAMSPTALAAARLSDSTLGTVSHVTGSAYLQRETERVPAAAGQHVMDGDRLETEIGRLEVSLARRAEGVLHLDHETALDLLSSDIWRLRRGRLRLTVGSREAPAPSRIDTPAGEIVFTQGGEYLVSLVGASDTRLSVVRGQAELRRNGTTVAVGTGEQVATRADGDAQVTTFNAAAWNAFDRWVESRRVIRVDRYATRVLRNRLQPVRTAPARPPSPATPSVPPTPMGPYASDLRPDVWFGTWPNRWFGTWPHWLVGPGTLFCCTAPPEDEAPVEPVAVIPIIAPDPDPDAAGDAGMDDAPATVAPVTRLTIVGLRAGVVGARARVTTRLPAIARGTVTRSRGGRHRVIALPPGGTHADRAAAPAAGPTSTAAEVASEGDTTAAAVIRPGTGVTSPRAPSRSTRYQHVTGRSASRAAARQP